MKIPKNIPKRYKQKLRISELIESDFDFSGDLKSIIEDLNSIMEGSNYIEHYSKTDCGYGDVYDMFNIYGYRLETDKEHEKRVNVYLKEREEKKKSKEESKERQIEQLKKLIKKYGIPKD